MDLENHRCDYNVYTIEANFINLLKQRLHLNQGHSFCNTFLTYYLPLRTLKNKDMAIASIILKLLSSNFTHLFSNTRATFWIRAASLKWILTKLSPFIELENHRCDYNVYTIEAYFINLLKLVYKKQRLHFNQGHSFCNTFLTYYLPLWT